MTTNSLFHKTLDLEHCCSVVSKVLYSCGSVYFVCVCVVNTGVQDQSSKVCDSVHRFQYRYVGKYDIPFKRSMQLHVRHHSLIKALNRVHNTHSRTALVPQSSFTMINDQCAWNGHEKAKHAVLTFDPGVGEKSKLKVHPKNTLGVSCMDE